MVNSPIPPTVPVRIGKQNAAEHKRNMQQAMVNSFTWECCLNCDQWRTSDDKCGKYDATPPIKVITIGCVDWECNIPF